MKAYIFKIFDANNKGVYREIQIPYDFNFQDFHYGILDAFEISAGEMASFFISNENYEKGEEITLMDMQVKEDEERNLLMNEVSLSGIIEQGVTFFVFNYDFLFIKSFNVQLIKETDVDSDQALLLNVVGEYQSSAPSMNDFLLEDIEGIDDFDGDYNDKEENDSEKKSISWEDEIDDDDDDDMPRFENIDDLDI